MTAIDLRTRYLGLDLPHPVVASASPLTRSVEGICRLADAGVAAPCTPTAGGGEGIGQKMRAIDEQQRLAVDPDVTWIAQVIGDVRDEREIVIGAVRLRDDLLHRGWSHVLLAADATDASMLNTLLAWYRP